MAPLKFSQTQGKLRVPGPAFEKLRSMTALVPQAGIAKATPPQILWAAHARTVATMKPAQSVVAELGPKAHTVLDRLARGHSYALDDAMPSLQMLDRALAEGAMRIPSEVARQKFYGRSAPRILSEVPVRANVSLFLGELGYAPSADSDEAIGHAVVKVAEHILQSAESTLIPIMQEVHALALRQAMYAVQGVIRMSWSTVVADALPLVELFANVAMTLDSGFIWDRHPILLRKFTEVLGTYGIDDDKSLPCRVVESLHQAIHPNMLVGDIAARSEIHLLKMHGIGKRAVGEIKGWLASLGLKLNMPIDLLHLHAAAGYKPWDVYPLLLNRVFRPQCLVAKTHPGDRNLLIGEIAAMTRSDLKRDYGLDKKELDAIEWYFRRRALQLGAFIDLVALRAAANA